MNIFSFGIFPAAPVKIRLRPHCHLLVHHPGQCIVVTGMVDGEAGSHRDNPNMQEPLQLFYRSKGLQLQEPGSQGIKLRRRQAVAAQSELENVIFLTERLFHGLCIGGVVDRLQGRLQGRLGCRHRGVKDAFDLSQGAKPSYRPPG